MSPLNPHDLLRLSTLPTLPPDAPSWVTRALSATQWIVVRRATPPAGRIAVGVRGANRSQRYAMEIGPQDVAEVVTPEQLAHTPHRRDLAALSTLHTVRPLFDAIGLPWGPTGSVGFELATGIPTATPDSDLDLLVRVSRPSAESTRLLVALRRELLSLDVRVDCQVETASGAVALVEWVGEQSEVMVRTAQGPLLVGRAIAMS